MKCYRAMHFIVNEEKGKYNGGMVFIDYNNCCIGIGYFGIVSKMNKTNRTNPRHDLLSYKGTTYEIEYDEEQKRYRVIAYITRRISFVRQAYADTYELARTFAKEIIDAEEKRIKKNDGK